MEDIIYFIGIFIVLYILFYLFMVKKARRNSKKVPVEVQYLLVLYNLDTKNFRYKQFMNTVALVASFDISLVATIVFHIEGFIWQLLFGFIFLVPVILLSFMLVGKYYQNKKEDFDLEQEEAEAAEIERKREEKKQKRKKRGGKK
jgi:hypothetical protein